MVRTALASKFEWFSALYSHLTVQMYSNIDRAMKAEESYCIGTRCNIGTLIKRHREGSSVKFMMLKSLKNRH